MTRLPASIAPPRHDPALIRDHEDYGDACRCLHCLISDSGEAATLPEPENVDVND